MDSNSSYNSAPQGAHGSGAWAPGTTVREIEGHFHKENEPQGVAPISETGGVPRVDYDPTTGEKIKGALGGNSGSSSSHHGTGSHSGSGLTGSSSQYDDRSTGDKLRDNVGSSSSRNDRYDDNRTGSGLTGSSHNNSSSNYDNDDHHKKGAGEKLREKIGGHDDYGKSPSNVHGPTGGATHGISDSAERDLNRHTGDGRDLNRHTGDNSHKTGLGATGDHSQQGHGFGTTTATGTAAPNSRTGDYDSSRTGADYDSSRTGTTGSSSGTGNDHVNDFNNDRRSGQAANKIGDSLTGRDNVSGSNAEAKAADTLTGAGGKHDHAPEERFGSGGHHGSSESPMGVHNSTVQQKEGVFEKLKHAIGK